MAAVCVGMAWAQDAPPPMINLPPVPHSQRASGTAMIDVQQPGFPAEVVLSQHDASHWMMGVQIANKAKQELMSVRLGWAYALAGGLEFHASDVIAPEQGVGASGTFSVPGEDVPVRPDAKGFLVFVEQATLADGSVANADHAAITAFYTQCCTAAGAANKGATQAALPRSATLTEPVVRIGPKVNAQGIGMIPVLQPDMPTEFVGVTQSAGDWLAGARLHNRSKYGYHTYRVGWAYVLPTGVEYDRRAGPACGAAGRCQGVLVLSRRGDAGRWDGVACEPRQGGAAGGAVLLEARQVGRIHSGGRTRGRGAGGVVFAERADQVRRGELQAGG
jgi:hypothetical protein